jgi:hypothetical protein
MIRAGTAKVPAQIMSPASILNAAARVDPESGFIPRKKQEHGTLSPFGNI